MRFKPRTSEIDGDHCANYATAICQHYFMWKFTLRLNPGRQLQSLVPLRLSPRPHRQFGLVLSILNTGISSYPIKEVIFAVKNNFTMTTQKEFTLCRRTNSISRERRRRWRRRCFQTTWNVILQRWNAFSEEFYRITFVAAVRKAK